jgi:hypothetical protein
MQRTDGRAYTASAGGQSDITMETVRWNALASVLDQERAHRRALCAHAELPRDAAALFPFLFLFVFLYISAWIPTHHNHGVCEHSAFYFPLLPTVRLGISGGVYNIPGKGDQARPAWPAVALDSLTPLPP